MHDTDVAPRARARTGLPVVVLVGLLAGVLAKLADLAPGPFGVVTSALGPWVALLVLVGVRAGTRTAAALRGAACLAAALVGYYVAYRLLDGNLDPLVVAFWSLAAVTAAPVLAVGARAAREGSRLGAAGAALPVGLLVAEIGTALLEPRWWTAGVDAALVVLVVRQLRPAFAEPSSRRRVLAWLPLAVLVGVVLLAAPRVVLGVLIGGR